MNGMEYSPVYPDGVFTPFGTEPSSCQHWVQSEGISQKFRCESFPVNSIVVKPVIQFQLKSEVRLSQLSLSEINVKARKNTDDYLWDILFPGQPKPARKVGATEKYEGYLGKLLPSDANIDISKELRVINNKSL
jgi:hypothetical protein